MSVPGAVPKIRISMVHPFTTSSELCVFVYLRLLRRFTLRSTRGLVTVLALITETTTLQCRWTADAISSSVLEDVDTGASNVDHYPSHVGA